MEGLDSIVHLVSEQYPDRGVLCITEADRILSTSVFGDSSDY